MPAARLGAARLAAGPAVARPASSGQARRDARPVARSRSARPSPCAKQRRLNVPAVSATRPTCPSPRARMRSSRPSASTRWWSSPAKPARGKTTQIPKMCLEAGLGIEAKIGCTQPRRVAALSISRRIAEELNVDWGREVGCKIRFDDRSSPQTYIKLMTDGILLAETQGDPHAFRLQRDHHRRSPRAQPEHRFPARLPQGPARAAPGSQAHHHLRHHRHRSRSPAPSTTPRSSRSPAGSIRSRSSMQPLDAASEESGDVSYIEAAVQRGGTDSCETELRRPADLHARRTRHPRNQRPARRPFRRRGGGHPAVRPAQFGRSAARLRARPPAAR